MRKYLIFCFVVLFSFCLKAQQEKGQVIMNVGVGYSPEFNGGMNFFGPIYPVGVNYNEFVDPGGAVFTNITPNIGATIDYDLGRVVSIGLASSYQSLTVNEIYGNNSDKITRTNITARILLHLNKKHPLFDHYIGIRFGTNYWGDVPSSNNYNPGGIVPYNYFLNNPNSFDHSFQFLYGMRIYVNNYIGVHFEVGIGEPYLVETGLTYRFNTLKSNSGKTPQQSDYGGHLIK